MNFTNIMKAWVDCENNPVLQRLRIARMMEEHEKSINTHIATKLLSEINADLERIMSESEMENEAP